MIPRFDINGNLPPGVHPASWREIATLFGGTAERRVLLRGMREAFRSLKKANCRKVYLDGSFVTDKEGTYGVAPNDFDGCWEPQGVDPASLDPVLLDFANRRAAQKAKFGGELFISTSLAAPNGPPFLEFFQTDKVTGRAKGIIAVDLSTMTESEFDFEVERDVNAENRTDDSLSKGNSTVQSQPVILSFDRLPKSVSHSPFIQEQHLRKKEWT